MKMAKTPPKHTIVGLQSATFTADRSHFTLRFKMESGQTRELHCSTKFFDALIDTLILLQNTALQDDPTSGEPLRGMVKQRLEIVVGAQISSAMPEGKSEPHRAILLTFESKGQRTIAWNSEMDEKIQESLRSHPIEPVGPPQTH